MRARYASGVLVAVVAAPVGGCFVVPYVEYGEEVEAVPVEPDEPFELRYTPVHGHEHRLWIDHTVEFDGWDFAIEGPLSVAIDGEVAREVDVLLNACDGPVPPIERVEAGTTQWTQWGSRVWLSATVFAIDVPGAALAREVVVRGEWSASDNVEVDALWLVVTD